jgi:hypothetical protein
MNQFIGNKAGALATTAHSNTIIGYQAYGITAAKTGSLNVAIGREALRSATSASQNMAIGASALQSATTGGSNVAIGRQAFVALTTGSSNVGIGAGTVGDDVTTGADNVFIGDASGLNLSTAHTGSVFVGASAGGGSAGAGVSGNHSIGIGPSAGQRLFGYQNISIGRRSGGLSAGGDISGNNNILIGAGAAPPANASSDQITFWVNTTSSGTVGYNALTRFTGGGWLINYTTSAVTTQTASAALEVNGTTGAVLFPRLTTAQRDALTPTDGMVLYNSTTNKLQVRAAGAWVDLH